MPGVRRRSSALHRLEPGGDQDGNGDDDSRRRLAPHPHRLLPADQRGEDAVRGATGRRAHRAALGERLRERLRTEGGARESTSAAVGYGPGTIRYTSPFAPPPWSTTYSSPRVLAEGADVADEDPVAFRIIYPPSAIDSLLA